MNNGRMWCVVNPTVGLPIFLGAVALTSMTVHHALLNNTTWVKDFLNGGHGAKVGMMDTTSPSVATIAPAGGPAFVVNVAPASGTTAQGETAFVITVSPKPATTNLALAAQAEK
jgi:light-harvesting protein B-800-850 alpha chain